MTDAIDTLNRMQCVFDHEFKGIRYDVGNKMGMVEANIQCRLKQQEIKDELIKYVKALVETL